VLQFAEQRIDRPENSMRDFLNTVRALGDETRVRILHALSGRELCVCQLVELLELAPSTVSKHMTVLSQAGLVQSRKEGRWVHYRRPRSPEPEARRALRWLDASEPESKVLARDAKRLEKILKVSREDLCRIQGRS
jgi:ArsR family transcriptional regulator